MSLRAPDSKQQLSGPPSLAGLADSGKRGTVHDCPWFPHHVARLRPLLSRSGLALLGFVAQAYALLEHLAVEIHSHGHVHRN